MVKCPLQSHVSLQIGKTKPKPQRHLSFYLSFPSVLPTHSPFRLGTALNFHFETFLVSGSLIALVSVKIESSMVVEKGKQPSDKVEDVEMKEETSQVDSPKTPSADPDVLTVEEIKDHAKHIDKYVSTKEPRFMLRILRSLVSTRKKLNFKVLRKVISGFYSNSPSVRDALLAFVDEPMDTDSSGKTKVAKKESGQLPILPELDVYLHLLLLIHLIDIKRFDQAVKCSELLMSKISSQNRRTLDLIAAKGYFYHMRVHELTGNLSKVKGFLHSRLRTATLKADYEGQAVLINCLLRMYLHYELYDQAAKLVTRSTFPEPASINEWARYLYYLGRIRAIQLDYSEAHKNLIQALRKAPQTSAIGFKQTVQKLAVTVELLLGDIPDRSLFRDPTLRRSLAPYFQLTQAVRMGNLIRFNQVLKDHSAKFAEDGTYTLIIRLRHNVIKTGVRMINMSYSRISLSDIAVKLALESPEDAEYIVAKAIKDGVIEATIDHDNKYLQSKDTVDVYTTSEPQAAFHQRIEFCLDIHNQSVKAMRFPPKSYNTDLESAEVSLFSLLFDFLAC